MKKTLRILLFKIHQEVIASLEIDNQTIFDTENFKCILAVQYNIAPEDIDVEFSSKEVFEPKSDLFISVTGKLCFYNDYWNVEIVEGFSYVNWLDLTTEEGINTLSDYKYLGKADELVKFN
jgi:predicted nucleic-acid-binding Zn-ribbon protein